MKDQEVLEKSSKKFKGKNLTVAATQTGNNRVINHVDDSVQTEVNFDTFWIGIAWLYLLLCFDILVVIVMIYLPYLVSFFVIADLILYNRYRMLFVDMLFAKRKITRKWWWLFIFTNLDWFKHAISFLCMAIIISFLFSFHDTFFEAIFEKQSVFTLNKLANNFILRLLSIPVNMNYFNEKLSNLLSIILKIRP